MEEKWLPLKDYEDLYEVSDKGRVKTLRTNKRTMPKDGIMKKQINHKGYVCVGLTDKKGKSKRCLVHRLVMKTFFPIEEELQVNHKDFDRTNNNLDNLEWVTCKQNSDHKVMNNRHHKGEQIKSSKLKEEEVIFIKRNYKPFDKEFGARPLAIKFGVSHTNILYIAKNESWNHLKQVYKLT